MTEKARTKVFWTAQEKDALCRQAAVLIHEMRVSRKLDALLQAQESVLPPQRRRKLLALTGTEWFSQGVTRELAVLRAAAAEPAVPPAPEHPAPEELLLNELWPLLRKRLVTELATFLSDVLQEVRWPSSGAPSSVVQDTVAAAVRRLRPAVASKPSVLIVGLKGGQLEEIRRDFSKTLDLRFCGSDENKERLRSMCEQADHAVALTDFISHAHEEILSRRARHYIRSGGGITRLKSVLIGLQVLQESAAA